MIISAINKNTYYLNLFGDFKDGLKLLKKLPYFDETILFDFYFVEAFTILKSTKIYESDSIARTLKYNFDKYKKKDFTISIFGEFYLADFMQTDIKYIDKNNTMDKFSEWEILRDNYFYNLDSFLRNCESMEFCSNIVYWEKPKIWSHYGFYISITDKGIVYYDNVLVPRILNKYKNISAVVDENGEFIKWHSL